MPSLHERSDGAYIVVDFYHQFRTWQLTGDGVRYLKGRGVRAGGAFGRDVLGELVTRGWAYTGVHRPVPPGEPHPRPPSPNDAALHERVRALCQALYLQSFEDAYPFVFPEIRDRKTAEEFKNEVVGPGQSRIVKWKVQDVVSWVWSSEYFPGVSRAGLATTDLEVVEELGAPSREGIQQDFWVLKEGALWYWFGRMIA